MAADSNDACMKEIKIFRPGLYPGLVRCQLRLPVAGQASLADG
jgi:hypothetical protein